MTKKEAEYEQKRFRILFGVASQLWELEEAKQKFGEKAPS
jgi:hypothetical protein